jgi:hypothetical protein
VLLGGLDVNAPVAPLSSCADGGEKKLAMYGFFFYNGNCSLLFEQVPKREVEKVVISQVERLYGTSFLRYISRIWPGFLRVYAPLY